MTEVGGTATFTDIIPGETLKEEIDPNTALNQKIIVAGNIRDKKQPRIILKNAEGATVQTYILPVGANIVVDENATVYPGDLLAKMPKESQKTKDITVGLPRIAELFEARKPKESAVLAEIDGIVRIESSVRGQRKLTIENEETRISKSYNISTQRFLNVRDGDKVKAGEPLIDGLINPHDLLAISGEDALERYLVDEIQEVYRKQGVTINDKHIEVIVRQMLKKVQIEDPGDSDFMPNEEVYKSDFTAVKNKLVAEGKNPPKGRPVMQGITKAAINTESFISAASFQETTKVLTDAACSGKTDYLRGLKENVMMGKLILAGTGSKFVTNKKFSFTK
jgi:DNA-directed RNA polymerase subunit beta'